jgi:predicted heme/steroid binding protein
VDIISDCIELNGRRLSFRTAYQMFKWFDERFHIVEGARDHLKEDELGIAKSEREEEKRPEDGTEKKAEARIRPGVPIEDLKPFTLAELKGFDGTDGKPIYIGYKGKVYDLSASPLFQGEKRMRCHMAGKDLTKDIDTAPHGEDLVFNFPVVGRVSE